MLLGYFLLAATWLHAIQVWGLGLFQNSLGRTDLFFRSNNNESEQLTILETSNSSSRGLFSAESWEKNRVMILNPYIFHSPRSLATQVSLLKRYVSFGEMIKLFLYRILSKSEMRLFETGNIVSMEVKVGL